MNKITEICYYETLILLSVFAAIIINTLSDISNCYLISAISSCINVTSIHLLSEIGIMAAIFSTIFYYFIIEDKK